MACTFWPERIGKWNFKRACRNHDVAYGLIVGFGWQAYLERLEADVEFAFDLMTDDIPLPLVAFMYVGVRRLGGYARMLGALKRKVKELLGR